MGNKKDAKRLLKLGQQAAKRLGEEGRRTRPAKAGPHVPTPAAQQDMES